MDAGNVVYFFVYDVTPILLAYADMSKSKETKGKKRINYKNVIKNGLPHTQIRLDRQ